MSGLAHKLLSKGELLDNELRARVMDYLQRNPGSYLGKISRDLGIPTSTLKYHLNILRSFEMVTTAKKGRCRHYFPRRRRFSDEEKAMYAAIEHGPTRRIVELVADRPGVSQAGLVQATGLSQSTVAWHMAKLVDLGLVRSERHEVKEYHLTSDFRTVFDEALIRKGVVEPPSEEDVEGMASPLPAAAPIAGEAPPADAEPMVSRPQPADAAGL